MLVVAVVIVAILVAVAVVEVVAAVVEVVVVVVGLHIQSPISPIYLNTRVIHKRYFTPKL